jgi:hypothetical protein
MTTWNSASGTLSTMQVMQRPRQNDFFTEDPSFSLSYHEMPVADNGKCRSFYLKSASVFWAKPQEFLG